MTWLKTISGIIILSVILGGCFWIDDDDDCCIPAGNHEEIIIYINQTEYVIDNFIDSEFVGSVAPDESLYVYSEYLEGDHTFFSRCQNCDLTWGPTIFTLNDGEVFRIYLEETGMRSEGQSQL